MLSCLDVLSYVYGVFLVFNYNTCFFFQAEDGIRELVRSRGLGDVYKRQVPFQSNQSMVMMD